MCLASKTAAERQTDLFAACRSLRSDMWKPPWPRSKICSFAALARRGLWAFARSRTQKAGSTALPTSAPPPVAPTAQPQRYSSKRTAVAPGICVLYVRILRAYSTLSPGTYDTFLHAGRRPDRPPFRVRSFRHSRGLQRGAALHPLNLIVFPRQLTSAVRRHIARPRAHRRRWHGYRRALLSTWLATLALGRRVWSPMKPQGSL